MILPANLMARSMPPMSRRLALMRAKASRRRIVGLPFMLVAAIAAAISAGAPIPAKAQGTGSLDLAGIRLYVGVSQGDLDPNNEQDLRAFAVLQEQIRAIISRLAKRTSDIRTADLSDWKYTDWEKLRPLPITHYIVAHPTKTTFQPDDKTKTALPVIEVEWHLGKFATNQFSPDRKPVYAALLREKTFITIPDSENKAAVWQRLSSEDEKFMPFRGSFSGSAEIAERIVLKLRMVFPEMREEHKYFVDCFDRGAYEGFSRAMMVHLSQFLKVGPQGVSLLPVWTFDSDDDVKDMCRSSDYRKQDNKVHRDEANFWVQARIASWHQRVQPLITIADRLRDDRRDTATVTDPDLGDEPGNAPLSEFCLRKGSKALGVTDLETLTAYIQARGFKARPPIDLGGWKCDAQSR
jgi:hypothetical protein